MPRNPHSLTVEATFALLQSSAAGLGDDEARARLARHGPNLLRVGEPASAWKILLDQLRSVVVLLLVAAAAISLAAGDALDAAAIASVLVLNTVLGFTTEIRARRAMEALLRLEAPRATVVRDGRTLDLDARELVPGDLVLLEPGQSIPADARVFDASDLRANEAPLTGESVPVAKSSAPVAEDAPLPERRCMLYKGTTVVAGTARAVVVGTGADTELGRIGGLVAAIPDERTPLEERLDALGRRLVWLALTAGALVAALGAVQGLAPDELLATGIALAIAAVPEGLPAVSTIALAVGVRRMARRNALVRRLPSVETLGSVTVICTDKTGTLTAGEMTVTVLALDNRTVALTGSGYEPVGTFMEGEREVAPAADARLCQALRIGALANHAGLERDPDGRWLARGDPTEAALLVAARKGGLERERLLASEPQVGEVPFSSERMFMATFHRRADGALTACMKGAPTRVLALCDRERTADGDRPLSEARRAELLGRNEALAGDALRVLALAGGRVARADEAALEGLAFVGLVGMMDPAAAGVAETVELFRAAGIRTVMITGDQRRTAEAIAGQLGILREGGEVLDGRELAHLSPGELAARVERVAAFSRVSPADKLGIVSALQERGEIVAMLGDGVNDAAALKKADVGVAMGLRGTDVAKEAAVVVLQDDSFRTVGAAVEEGRVIYDNIRKFVFYLFSCNLAEVLVLLVAGVAGLPPPLLPLQILWLNLVTDTFPALALALEPAEPGIMRRPPRDPQRAILSAPFLRAIGTYAVLITGSTLAAFLVGLSGPGGGGTRPLTMSFMTLALAQVFHLGNARSHAAVVAPRRALANRYALGAVVVVLLLQALAVEVPLLARLLGVQPLALADWAVVAGLALVPAVVGQALKLGRSRG